ncbi:hypothetical protein F4780DRAFT_677675 [Xylariomycetidae sp. FL0641]|nr:hypothetical protein F4780DRAFT_677675 [Xylariomycetidae sp. FL0641]
MPHHRPRHRHRPVRTNEPAAEAIDNASHSIRVQELQDLNCDLKNPNRHSSAPKGHGVVEDWLGRLVIPDTHPPSSLGSPNETADHHKRSLPRADGRNLPLWWPQHILSAASNGLDAEAPTPYPQSNSKRKKRDSSDSSLISGFEGRPSDGVIVNPRRSRKPSIETEGSPSAMSYAGGRINYEKRPRHKTREDKYDTKKQKHQNNDRKRAKDDREPRPGKSNRSRKRAMMSSKNVMTKFASDAVTTDRITVPPNLKPGLFDNGRVSKKQPIPDLAFSEMQFLKQQKRRETQPKTLSKKRLKEKQRESRELEEVSSFFLPPKPDVKPRNPATATGRGRRRSLASSVWSSHKGVRDAPKTIGFSPSRTDLPLICEPAPSQSEGGTAQILEIPRSKTAPHLESSKATTYFTWSRSGRSHSPTAHSLTPPGARSSSNVSDAALTMTPEAIRRALVATGIYRNTGIHPYDATMEWSDDGDTAHYGSVADTSLKEDHVSDRSWSEDSNEQLERRPGRLDIRRRSLERRWHAILSPVLGNQRCSSQAYPEPERDSTPGERPEAYVSHAIPFNERPTESSHRFQYTEDQNAQMQTRRQSLIGPSDYNEDQNTSSFQGSGLLDCNTKKPKLVMKPPPQTSTGRDSRASREAMPPPPIPVRRAEFTDATRIGESTRPNDDRAPTDAELPGNLTASSRANAQTSVVNPVIEQNALTALARARDHGRAPSSLDLMSWIPQARTPLLANHAREQTVSRLSIRSPIYVSQLSERSRSGLQPAPVSTTEAPSESMGDFIARIENEVHAQSPTTDDYYLHGAQLARSITRSSDGIGFELALPTMEDAAYNEPANAEDEAEPNYTASAQPISGQPSRDYQPFDSGISGEAILLPTEDLEDEYMEMSRFWRPNQFSQF